MLVDQFLKSLEISILSYPANNEINLINMVLFYDMTRINTMLLIFSDIILMDKKSLLDMMLLKTEIILSYNKTLDSLYAECEKCEFFVIIFIKI